jgi:hypothetical protein
MEDTRYQIATLLILFFIASTGLLFSPLLPFEAAPTSFVQTEKHEVRSHWLFVQQLSRYPAWANVTEYNRSSAKINIGVANQPYELVFGRLPISTTSRKIISISNKDVRPTRVRIFAFGDASEFMRYPDTFLMAAGESREIAVEFDADVSGVYDGELVVRNTVPRYSFLDFLVEVI